MKPRTKFQHKVAASIGMLQPLSPTVKNWAISHNSVHVAFHSAKGKVCSDCCSTFEYKGQSKTVRCPRCGAELQIVDNRRRTYESLSSFSVFEVVNEIQVMRVFQINSVLRKGQLPEIDFLEVVDMWFDEKGKYQPTARKRPMHSWSLDKFITQSSMELRNLNQVYENIADNADVYPELSLTPYFEKKGLYHAAQSVYPFSLFMKVEHQSQYETIIKRGHVDLADTLIGRRYIKLENIWDSYKITLRHSYHIENFGLWIDLISCLKECGKDVRNPHYICPDNLLKSHDYWHEKVEAKAAKESEKRRLQRELKDEANFIKEKGRYFDISFTDGEIRVVVLQSVKEYQEEGKLMHHCVAGYYRHSDSLVLSARKDDKILETVEISLHDFSVLQSRGVCNSNTEFHDRIIALVEQNKHLFAKASA